MPLACFDANSKASHWKHAKGMSLRYDAIFGLSDNLISEKLVFRRRRVVLVFHSVFIHRIFLIVDYISERAKLWGLALFGLP